MMKMQRKLRQTSLLNFSPWILGAACILLLLVIAFFAVSNFQREKNLIKSAIEQKGLTLVRFINSTVSGSVRFSLSRSGSYEKWEDNVQPALELAVEQPGVDGIEVLDKSGALLLSAGESVEINPELKIQIGQILQSVDRQAGSPWQTVVLPKSGSDDSKAVFVSLYNFPGMNNGHSPGGRGPMMGGRFRHNPNFQEFSDDMARIRELEPVYVVWLDMEQFSAPLKRQFVQIVLELAAIILVGIGGTLSFFTLKGLRGSEEDLGKVTVFNNILVSSLPVGLIASDEKGVVQVVNEAAEKMTGILSHDCKGQSPRICLPEGLGNLFALENVREGGDIHRELVIETDHGRQKKVLDVNVVSVRSHNAEPSGEVMLLRDLSKVKRLEQELQRSERLAAIGKMAAGVAHELRNPLSSIKGLALLLKNKVDGGSVETADTLVREVERLNRSIGELLDYAKPAVLQKEPSRIENVVEKTLLLLEPDLDEQHVEVITEFDCDVPEVMIDPDKIRQVLLNIVLNAIQAMEDNPSQRKLHVAVKNGEGQVRVSITDNGSGISADALKKVFDPYFTTKNSGTGLGLALSLKIIEEHDGALQVESNPGEYTMFQFSLPVV